jgi:hypothetical protein
MSAEIMPHDVRVALDRFVIACDDARDEMDYADAAITLYTFLLRRDRQPDTTEEA